MSWSWTKQPYSEYNVKLVFIEKFTHFIDWPEPKSPTSSKYFNIGIYGTNPFGDNLTFLAKNRKIKDLPIKVEFLSNLSKIDDLNLLFIASDRASEINEITEYITNRPILTISDVPLAETKGVLINFYVEDEKIKFYINNQRASKSNLVIHSPLLKIATIVK